jgi:hypothetical protein
MQPDSVTRSKVKKVIALVVLVVLVVGFASRDAYIVSGKRVDAELAWSKDEVLIFAWSMQLGWSGSWYRAIQDAAFLFFVGASIESPQQRHDLLTVVRYRHGAVQTYSSSDKFDQLRIIDGNIYSRGARWAGDHFQQLTDDERRTLFQRDSASERSPEQGGWSVRHQLLSGGKKEYVFPVETRDERLDVVVRRSRASMTIDLRRAGAHEERVWAIDQRAHLVTRAEYEERFRH